MKITSYLALGAALVGSLASASAQTVINITGATAFRQAAHQAIIDSFDAGSLTYGYQGTNIGNAGRAIFSGTINSGADAIVVRTSWSGSVAGIRAIVNQADSVTYFAASPANLAALTSGGNASFAGSTDTTTQNSIAFADNVQENTPFTGVSLLGGPVGVVAFVPVVNETPAIAAGTNVTELQLRRLMTAGSAPLQFITGNSSDSGKRVYWTGRQDTSGTRVIYLAEAGVGASGAVQQYRVEPLTNNATSAITAIRLWPTGDTTNRSVIWGPDATGNGGYASGGALAPVLQRAGNTTVNILDPVSGNVTSTISGSNLALISVISAQEGQDIQNGGGKVLAYNGHYIEPEALPLGLSAADKDKIIKGQYTLWSYENLFYRDDIVDQPVLDFITLLETQVSTPANIGGNGIAISEMRVSRSTDGGSLTVSGSLP